MPKKHNALTEENLQDVGYLGAKMLCEELSAISHQMFQGLPSSNDIQDVAAALNNIADAIHDVAGQLSARSGEKV